MRTRASWVLAVTWALTGCGAGNKSPGVTTGQAGAGSGGTGAGVAGSTGAGGATAGAAGGSGAAGSAGVDAAAGETGLVDAASGGGSGAAGAAPSDGGTARVSGAPAAGWPNQALLYTGVMTTPPKLTDTDETTDAPLLGNGDLGVAILGGPGALTFNLHKNEFWSLGEAKVKAMEQIVVALPTLAGASYHMVEDIGHGEVTGTFALGAQTLTTKTWVQADDSTRNKVVTQLSSTGGTIAVTVSLKVGAGNVYASSTGAMGDLHYRDVRADATDAVGGRPTRRVRVATRVVGATGTATADGLTFTVGAGPVSLVTGVMSDRDDAAFQTAVLTSLATLAPKDVEALDVSHRGWWDAFFKKSFVEIPDKTLEREYYASLYFLASVSRAGEQPPGLWGNWVMKDPAWNGDYTLNYNYEVPFYASFPTNHVELADSYDEPVIAWVPNAQALASKNGYTGAYFRVHIGPIPNGSADANEWNQKFNNAYAATVMIMHWYFTHDAAYAARVYPTLKQMSTFWAGYLVKTGGRYVINDDAQHEGNAFPQMNGVMSLGLVRFLLQASIDLAAALGTDADLRATWQDRLTNLSAFPTFTKNGKTVFRYTEVGLDWNGGNSIGIQHVYPGSQIGLGSDAMLLATAQNMVTEMARWSDGNGTNTFYPAAARVGHDPADILTHLSAWVSGQSYANLHIHTGGGGIENFNTVPSTIAEMLLQSFQGQVRVFADWPSTADARFGDLRAYGAFLVSSQLKGGAVQYVRVASERGGPLVLVNPWPGKMLRLYRNGTDAGTLGGTEITIPTTPGELLSLATDGTSYADIVSRLSM
jgi:alpha-L-fucosidase 2